MASAYNNGRYKKAIKVWMALQNIGMPESKLARWNKRKELLDRVYSSLSKSKDSEQEFASAIGLFGIYYVPKRKNTIFSKPVVEKYLIQSFGREDDGSPIDKKTEFRFGGNEATNRSPKIFKYDELVEARQIVYNFRNSDEGGRTWGMKVGYTSRCWYEDVYCVLVGINKPGVPIWTGNPYLGKWYTKYTGRDWITGFSV